MATVSFNSLFFSDEFCDGYPHNVLPTPGYWIECSRAISNQGSAWTNDDRDLHEIDEGITDSPDGSIRDDEALIGDNNKEPGGAAKSKGAGGVDGESAPE